MKRKPIIIAAVASLFIGTLFIGFADTKKQPFDINTVASAARRQSTKTPVATAATTPMTLQAACKVTKAVKVDAGGGDQDWSHASNVIIYDKVDANKVYQLNTMMPAGTNKRCLTCAPTGNAPAAARHKFNPSWHPSGQYAVAQVEKESHPLTWAHTEPFIAELMLNGLWTDLYVFSADGSTWHQLTNTSIEKTDGVLAPTFSPDGTKLMWSQLLENSSDAHPFGIFRLMIADFSMQDNVPQLTNVRDITPPEMTDRFVESHVISPDGTTALVSSDLGAIDKMHMHVYKIDLATLQSTRVSRDDTWNEHATFTVDGQHIVYMAGIPWYLFSTDLVMVDLDGSDWMQLTHFNAWFYPEYAGELTFAARTRFNADGTQASVTTQSLPRYPARDLWVLTFAGKCGNNNT